MKKLIAIVGLVCTSAHAEFWTGNVLLDRIKSENVVDRALGLGYVMGAFDNGHGATHCTPQNVTAGQAQDMVKQHLESVPSARHLPAEAHVTYIFGKT